MQEIKISIPQSSLDDSLRPVSDELTTVNGYLVYSNFANSDLVTEFSVRDFLDDERNKELSIDFFAYLKGNTNNQEFDNIVYDDKKLSDVLNEYYNTVIRASLKPTNLAIKENLTGTTVATEKNNSFNILNKRIKQAKPVLIGINTGTSFYVDVFIERNNSAISPLSFNEIVKTTIEDGIVYVQGFVDLNNKTDIFEGITFTRSSERIFSTNDTLGSTQNNIISNVRQADFNQQLVQVPSDYWSTTNSAIERDAQIQSGNTSFDSGVTTNTIFIE